LTSVYKFTKLLLRNVHIFMPTAVRKQHKIVSVRKIRHKMSTKQKRYDRSKVVTPVDYILSAELLCKLTEQLVITGVILVGHPS